MTFWLIYTFMGVLSGFLAGLLGIGGGVLLVPLLTMVYLAKGFSDDVALHLALGSSMATIVFTAVSSLLAHQQRGAILWNVVRSITPGILLGTLAGSLLAARVPTRPLAIFFVCFVLVVAVQMLLDKRPSPGRELPGRWGMGGTGFLIGTLSSLVAVGGGSMTVPFLTWCNVRIQHAIGTSAAVGLPIAIGGSLGYIANGWQHTGLPEGSLGYIYLPALVFLVPASMLIAPQGAKLAHRLPVSVLKKIFAALLVILAAKMAYSLH